MSKLRFVHAADLHLDSPFSGLRAVAPPSVAKALHNATFEAYKNLIDLCIDEQVDALLVAGDIFDSADRSLRAQRAFVSGLERLHEAGIRSFICHGNHDPLEGWEAQLTYPSSCHRFGRAFECVPFFDSSPDSAVVYGISYPVREVRENLVYQLGRVDPDRFSIGLLHANVGGNPNHDAYASCTLSDLEQTGVDYWALGHVHARQILRDGTPTVAYPGNPQGKNPTETGAKGVYLVEVADDRSIQHAFHCTDVVRWASLRFDISDSQTEQELLDDLGELLRETLSKADGRSVVVRLTLTGRGSLSAVLRRDNFVEELRDEINKYWSDYSPFTWCERIENQSASPFNRAERVVGSDFVAEFLRVCNRAKNDHELQDRLRANLDELLRHHRFRRDLPDELHEKIELSDLIDEAESIAIDLLTEVDET
ncbi:MAG: DNA repair exonuclease [Chloroflexi bacterium]|nr:DNA repair exonuclease [Chloroflexota bacterium]